MEKLTTTASLPGRSEAFHQFLKLTQPIEESMYPQPRVLEAGRTYKFPFLFVVPQQMLPRICRHTVLHESVRDAHLQLPPSLGDKTTPLDDLAPDMAIINYSVMARVTRAKGEEKDKNTLAHVARKVRIVPSTSEHPPVDIDGEDGDYTMRSSKKIKKGVFKGKLGTLTMSAAQPKSLRLPSPTSHSDIPVSTMATVKLRFDPADPRAQPPRLTTLSAKIGVKTFFASTARTHYPNKKSTMYDLSQGVHGESISLPSRCVAGVEWTYHSSPPSSSPSSDLERRDSACSLSPPLAKLPTPSANPTEAGFYTAQILVPISLPQASTKTFVPTFHTCLISRIYNLSLHLGVHSNLGPSLELKVPLQISSSGSASAQAEQESRDQEDLAAEEREVEGFFEPRRIGPMREELVGGSQIPGAGGLRDAPPQYEVLPSGGLRVPAYA